VFPTQNNAFIQVAINPFLVVQGMSFRIVLKSSIEYITELFINFLA